MGAARGKCRSSQGILACACNAPKACIERGCRAGYGASERRESTDVEAPGKDAVFEGVSLSAQSKRRNFAVLAKEAIPASGVPRYPFSISTAKPNTGDQGLPKVSLAD
jgi:hypothetical protein